MSSFAPSSTPCLCQWVGEIRLLAKEGRGGTFNFDKDFFGFKEYLRMMIKPGVNFINTLIPACYAHSRSQMCKNDSQVVNIFYAFVIYERKSCL